MKTILTGIKPTGEPHLGNYIGAIQPALKQAEENSVKSYFFIADYHSLTSLWEAKELSDSVRKVAATWLACGLDTKKTYFYLQSDIPEILELHWILSCIAPKGLMNRAHSYKAKLSQNQESGRKDLEEGIYMGLYNYPILMSADILLFSADKVPVGKDQIQHLEIAKDLAEKFNHIYKTDFLKSPEALLQKQALVLGLDGQKMSKSYKNHIPLFCDSKTLRKYIMKIKTDSTPPETPKDTKTSLIFHFYQFFATESEQKELKEKFQNGIGWGEAKEILFQKLDSSLKDKREKYQHYLEDPKEIRRVLEEGKEKTLKVAKPFLSEIRKIVGIES